MSLIDFNDFYFICCDCDKDDVYEDVIMVSSSHVSMDPLPYPDSSRRWWEMAVKEILNEKKDGVLV